MSAKDTTLKEPRKPRDGETIGGGFFVFRRGDSTNRIRPANWPFEYDSEDAALREAVRLAALMPGHKFQVVAVLHTIHELPANAEVAAHA